MYKKFLWGIAAMAALTLVSCSSDDLDSLSDNSSKNEAISFDSYLGRSAVAVNGSRGSVLDNKTLPAAGFGVFGNYIADDGKTSNSNFFTNQKVTYSTTESKWTYSPLRFWPTQGKIDFLAYAPYVENKTLTDGSKIDFAVSEAIGEQKDLLWAKADGKRKDNISTDKNKVKFQFAHALSRLGYTVKLSGNYASNNVTFTLKNIKLAGSAPNATKSANAFYKNGTIDLSTGNWEAHSTDAAKQDFNWYSGEYNIPEPESGEAPSPSHPNKKDEKGNREKDNDYLFVIPQDFSDTGKDKLYVIVEYDITYNDGTKTTITNKVYKQIKQNFEQSKAYMINLTLGLPIEFDAAVTEWGLDTPIDCTEPWDK